MPYTDMTTWVTGPNGTRFCLATEPDGKIRILMRRPAGRIDFDTKVLSIVEEKDEFENSSLVLIRHQNIPNTSSLRLTNKGEITLSKKEQ